MAGVCGHGGQELAGWEGSWSAQGRCQRWGLVGGEVPALPGAGEAARRVSVTSFGLCFLMTVLGPSVLLPPVPCAYSLLCRGQFKAGSVV